jgi:hypothetical protein
MLVYGVYAHSNGFSLLAHDTDKPEGQINKGMPMEACLSSILSMEGEKEDLFRPGTFVAVVA